MASEADNQLETFIRTVLTQISSAVATVQSTAAPHGFVVNPGSLQLKDQAGVVALSKDGVVCSKVEFDLTVTVEHSGGAEGGLKVSLFGNEASLGGKANISKGATQSVRFFVPVQLPHSAKKEPANERTQ